MFASRRIRSTPPLARLLSAFAIVIGLLSLSPLSLFAQDTILTVGENAVSETTATNSIAIFTIEVSQPTRVTVQVLAITPSFAPSLTVRDASGAALAARDNPSALASLAAGVRLPTGVSQIEVGSANGSVGQFVVSVQPDESVVESQTLLIGQAVSASGNATYTFGGSNSQTLIVTVRGADNVTPNITLLDAESGETLAVSSGLAGVRYVLPLRLIGYELNISVEEPSNSYFVCLEPEITASECGEEVANFQPTALATDVVVVQAPTAIAPAVVTQAPIVITATTSGINPVGVCSVTPSGSGAVNIRGGASTSFPILAPLPVGQILPAIGRLADNTWYQVNRNGVIGWVSASVVQVGGQCNGVPVVNAPTLPTLAATTTATLAATFTASPTGTTTATATASATFTATATATTTAPGLNFSLPAVFGSTSLISGFVPDPFTVGVTAGGPASASSVGSGCRGFTTSAPSFSVNYTSGSFTLLRFYAIMGGDTTMIINTPAGNYVCVDDSFGTVDPTIDFNNPSSGRYDVWVATFSQGGSIGGTLFVTESSGNRP